MTQETLKHLKAITEAFGPDAGIELDQKAWAKLHTAIKEALAQQEKDYERGFVDGMQKQMQSSVDKAVNRMAQPEQEPWCMKMNGCKTKCEDCPDEPPQPEQEPVAWMFQHDETGRMNYVSNDGVHNPTIFLEMNPRYALVCPLYTTPPQRKFVGLTDEEIDAIYTGVRAVHREIDSDVFARAIEAKLKEKNNG